MDNIRMVVNVEEGIEYELKVIDEIEDFLKKILLKECEVEIVGVYCDRSFRVERLSNGGKLVVDEY